MRLTVFCAFVATVWAANWALTIWGVVPVLPGLYAPAGVFFAGLGFLLRDALHELGGRAWVLSAIGCGAVLSWWVGAGVTIPGGHLSIAVSSACAFGFSELADLSVYAPVRRRNLGAAVGLSQVAGATCDSLLFLWLAFGSLALVWGQFVGKTLMVVPFVAVLLFVRGRKAIEAAA